MLSAISSLQSANVRHRSGDTPLYAYFLLGVSSCLVWVVLKKGIHEIFALYGLKYGIFSPRRGGGGYTPL